MYICLRGTFACGEPPLGRSGSSLWVQGRNPDLIPLIAGHRAQERGRVPYILTPKENEQAPVIPLCNCCASTRRPIETGPIFRNSFMTFLTHMQFHGLKTKIPALLEFMLGSPFLIFPCLLTSKPLAASGEIQNDKVRVVDKDIGREGPRSRSTTASTCHPGNESEIRDAIRQLVAEAPSQKSKSKQLKGIQVGQQRDAKRTAAQV